MKKTRLLPLFLLFSALALFGMGCAKKDQLKPGAQVQEQPYLPPEQALDKNSDAYKRAQLDRAIKNFRAATSLRAKMTKEDPSGSITGQLEYVKPLRLRAAIKMADGQEVGMVAIGPTMYVQLADKKWLMDNNANAKNFVQDFFASMVSNGDTLASFGVPADTPVHISENPVSKCNEFKTKYKSNDKSYDLDICVNDKPEIVYMETQTADGQIRLDYSDFNSLIVIERPVLPLLQTKLPAASP